MAVKSLTTDAEFVAEVCDDRTFLAKSVLCKAQRRHFRLGPPLRPRARAAASPAIVLSRISSRSNSASGAKMPNTNLPAAVVVSIAAP
jgi:hypothetical protein